MSSFVFRVRCRADQIDLLISALDGASYQLFKLGADRFTVRHPDIDNAPDIKTGCERLRATLRAVAATIQIYLGNAIDAELDGCDETDDSGTLHLHSFSAHFPIVISPQHVREALEARGNDGDPLCARMAVAALKDSRLGLMLELIGSRIPGWREVYDVIEC